MANSLSYSPSWTPRLTSSLSHFFGITKHIIPWEVETRRVKDQVVVSAIGYWKAIPMRDSLWMRLAGQTWEGKVVRAQQEAFMVSYRIHKEEEKRSYQVKRFA